MGLRCVVCGVRYAVCGVFIYIEPYCYDFVRFETYYRSTAGNLKQEYEMAKDEKDNSLKSDILTGVVLVAISFTLLSLMKFHVAFLIIVTIAFFAGILRGGNVTGNKALKVVILNSPFFILLLPAMNGMLNLLMLLIAVLASTYTGLYVRQRFKDSKFAVSGIIVMFAIAVFLSGTYVSRSLFDAMMWKKSNEKAPEYKLLSISGDSILSDKHYGKVIVLDFWASWCGPCKRQFPEFEDIFSKYQGNENIAFMSVNSFLGGDTYEKAISFIDKNSIETPVVFDTNGEAAKNFEVSSIPTIIIIDKKGIIRHIHRGYDESENFPSELSKRIEALIAE
jgi:cytochrome c biogenesis protein CcmG, thiol:disulfide interchange protein DsbE